MILDNSLRLPFIALLIMATVACSACRDNSGMRQANTSAQDKRVLKTVEAWWSRRGGRPPLKIIIREKTREYWIVEIKMTEENYAGSGQPTVKVDPDALTIIEEMPTQ